MAFDFPAAPAIGDKYADPTSGTEYIWTGSTWDLSSGGDMSDYVLKEGDVMSGPLLINTAGHSLQIGNATSGIKTISISASGTPHAGIIEFWDPANGTTRHGYMGYGDANYVDLNAEGGRKWRIGGGLYMNEGAGIHWGNTPAQTDPLNFSEGICLYGYGGSSQFGFTITGGTLNYVVQTTSNQHAFLVGSEVIMNVKTDGVRIPGGNLNVTGTIAAAGNISIRDNDSFDLSNGYYIRKVSGVQNMFFHGGQSNAYFTFHITGFGDAFVIDKVGSTGNSVSVTAPDALALADELGVAADPERGVDLVKMLAAALLRIKQLESR